MVHTYRSLTDSNIFLQTQPYNVQILDPMIPDIASLALPLQGSNTIDFENRSALLNH